MSRRRRTSSRSKYGNRPVTVDGVRYDSEKEYARWKELQLMEKAGIITDLQRQVPFELQPAFYHKGQKIQAIKYVADFTYYDENGEYIIEDSKGVKTREYINKKKMMLYRGYEIKET